MLLAGKGRNTGHTKGHLGEIRCGVGEGLLKVVLKIEIRIGLKDFTE